VRNSRMAVAALVNADTFILQSCQGDVGRHHLPILTVSGASHELSMRGYNSV
jgi:hypothetical protein